MTPDEHKLMVFMFAQQTVRLTALLEFLKSRDVLEADDFDAFEHFALEQFGPEAQLKTIQQYTAFAQALGLTDQLPKPEGGQSPTRAK